nr:putative ribonuclease H-like domain-containing protein [Tanacetum cinerariifolium]
MAITTEDMQKRKNDVKARTTLLLALPDEHQLRFSKYDSAKELWEAILKTFDGNEATEKAKKNQLNYLEFMDVPIEQDDLNQKIDDDDIEEMDIKWNMALLSMRVDRFWKKAEIADHQGVKTEGKERESYKKDPKVEEPTPKAMIAIDGAKNKGWPPTIRPKIPIVGSKVPAAKLTVAADKGNKGKAVKASTRWIWKPKKNSFGQGLNFNGVLLTFKKCQYIDTQDMLKSDSGCARYMTGNTSYLSKYEPFNRGYVSFGHGRGKITGKGLIKTGKLEFENVYFMEELKYNLFSVSQICNNKNSVLFTDTECLMLGKDFKLVDDKHVLLRAPRQQNMYTIDLKNVVPYKNLTCLIVKASMDESMLWHRRLGHLNFKTMNKLVRSNLVKGLPSKSFENNHSVACLKVKQHKASYKFKLVNSVSKPLYTLHMDLFRPTSVSSLNHKWYYLVVTDDFSSSIVETEVPIVSTPVPTDSLSVPPVTLSVLKIIYKGGSSFPDLLSFGNAMSFKNRLEDFFGDTSDVVSLNDVEADLSNTETAIQVSLTPTLRIHKDHLKSQIIGPVDTLVQTRQKTKNVDA